MSNLLAQPVDPSTWKTLALTMQGMRYPITRRVIVDIARPVEEVAAELQASFGLTPREDAVITLHAADGSQQWVLNQQRHFRSPHIVGSGGIQFSQLFAEGMAVVLDLIPELGWRCELQLADMDSAERRVVPTGKKSREKSNTCAVTQFGSNDRRHVGELGYPFF